MQATQKPVDALKVFWSANRVKPKQKKRLTELPGGMYVKTSAKHNLLTIPKEIRNHIYSYVFDAVTLVCLMGQNYLIPKASHPSKDHMIKFSGTLGKNKFFHGKNTKWATSVTGLHLVNKQISRECLGHLYNRIILFSDTSRRLISWIETVSPHRLALLTQLYLDHVTYGDPKLFDNGIWKIKSDYKWAEACRLAVQSFPHLTKLVINIDVHDTPFRFSLKEPWLQPLLYFKQLQELKEVEVHVHSPYRRSTFFDVNRWEDVPAFYVRQLVINDKGNNELHELFGLAVSMKILGFCDDCCLEELRDALFGRWKDITVQPAWSDIVQP
jgi:hypothetical protein